MQITRQPPVKTTLKPSSHPYLSGPWTPVHEELDVERLEVIEGAIPADIDGIYLRNTENPVHQPLGRHHPFDGDAMIHQVSISGGTASYRNRFVRTNCFAEEQIADGSLWGGLMDPPALSKRPGFGAHGSLKDTGSTDIVVHAGVALATFYQCGEAWQMDPVTLDNLGKAPWGPLDGVSAHPKVDETTGELMFFNYSKHAPFMHYGVVDRAGKLVHYVPIPLSGPRLPHDMAITKNWSILNDMPLFWDEELLKRDIHAARIHDGMPTRFALIPRHGQPEDIRWFEASPTYVLHWTNAYEVSGPEGDEVVLEGYYQDKPMPDPIEEAGEYSHMMAYVDEHSFQSRLHRWRFNLATGECHEERLSDRIVEFGMINPDYLMQKSRYIWSTTTRPGWFLFNGYVRHDTETGEEQVYELPEGVYASESPMVPRKRAKSSSSAAVGQTTTSSEDEGYLITFLIDENSGTSECAILDASDIAKGLICRLALPHKISSGVHSTWVEHSQLRADVKFRKASLEKAA